MSLRGSQIAALSVLSARPQAIDGLEECFKRSTGNPGLPAYAQELLGELESLGMIRAHIEKFEATERGNEFLRYVQAWHPRDWNAKAG